MPRLLGQRWVYRLGNSTLIIDNAFSWTLWGQERMIINDETVKEASGWMTVSRSFAEPWLTSDGETEIRVAVMGGVMSLTCETLLNGQRLNPEACFSARWEGERHSWPANQLWEERPVRHAIAFTRSRKAQSSPKG